MIEFKDNINVMFLYYNHFGAYSYLILGTGRAIPLQKYDIFRTLTSQNDKNYTLFIMARSPQETSYCHLTYVKPTQRVCIYTILFLIANVNAHAIHRQLVN